MRDLGWLIEMPGPVWWNGGPVTDGCVIWTPAHLDAVRFVRKKDAEAVIARMGLWNARATEHEWLPVVEGERAPESATKEKI